MKKPKCGLCERTATSCTFPTKRKKPQRRRQENQTDSQKLERLVCLLESRLGEGQDIEMLLSQTEQLPMIDLQTPNSLDRARDDSNDDSQSEIIVVDTSNTRDTSTSPASTIRSADADTNWLSLPGDVLTDLVNLFFAKIQGWLPLLHRPRFFRRYMKDGAFIKRNYSITEAFLLCDRGRLFEEQATTYFEKCQFHQQPSLETLQGCLMLAAYIYASGPSHRGWVLVGVCVRLAYDLNLCNMDEQDESMDWSILEEQRRAFWITWELDTFGSSITRRPSSINRSMVAVRLPTVRMLEDSSRFTESGPTGMVYRG
ncbi:hypothetical protein FBEOM_6152 [Fusarium beomiforme]|uniref:Xylanolytic transcriptional activator regulatory domain-containing protein n=1 Tax=Fusarium beomiforme TaxID=44412 RepID=A0A9P5DZB4_9HYPO|nr:hypothetical protein FBEOM_6152 [Fusarium beomiforme]